MAVNGIEIKVGQVWRTRSGDNIRVVGYTPGDRHCWLLEFGLTVDDHGCPASVPCAHDLIELIREADGPQEIRFEPGDAGTLAIEMLTDLGWVFTDGLWVQDSPPAYASLADVLHRALLQASQGKGKERHASGDTPFEEQPMATINRQIGSVHGFIYQAHKKSLESLRLPAGRDVAELLGAINYLAGAVIALESWARKEGV